MKRLCLWLLAVLCLPTGLLAAPSKQYTAPGSQIVFADVAQSPNAVLSFAPGGIGLGPGIGRVSTRYDKGAGSQPSLWELRCHLSLTGTNTIGNDVQFYIATSDGVDIDAGMSATDGAITTDQRRALTIGPFVFQVYQTTTNTTMFTSFRNIYIPGRYFSLVVFNNTVLPLQSSTSAHRCLMTPMPYEMQ